MWLKTPDVPRRIEKFQNPKVSKWNRFDLCIASSCAIYQSQIRRPSRPIIPINPSKLSNTCGAFAASHRKTQSERWHLNPDTSLETLIIGQVSLVIKSKWLFYTNVISGWTQLCLLSPGKKKDRQWHLTLSTLRRQTTTLKTADKDQHKWFKKDKPDKVSYNTVSPSHKWQQICFLCGRKKAVIKKIRLAVWNQINIIYKGAMGRY